MTLRRKGSRTHAHTHSHKHTRTHTHTHKHVHIHIYSRTRARTHTLTQTHSHTHTHTHTHTRVPWQLAEGHRRTCCVCCCGVREGAKCCRSASCSSSISCSVWHDSYLWGTCRIAMMDVTHCYECDVTDCCAWGREGARCCCSASCSSSSQSDPSHYSPITVRVTQVITLLWQWEWPKRVTQLIMMGWLPLAGSLKW